MILKEKSFKNLKIFKNCAKVFLESADIKFSKARVNFYEQELIVVTGWLHLAYWLNLTYVNILFCLK